MKVISTSVTALAAVGMVLAAGAAANACDWQVTAQATPVPDVVATPATAVDPMTFAKLDKVAILPVPPREEKTATE